MLTKVWTFCSIISQMSEKATTFNSNEANVIQFTYQCLEAMEELKRKLSLLDLFCYQNFNMSTDGRRYEDKMSETLALIRCCEATIDEGIEKQFEICEITPSYQFCDESDPLSIIFSDNPVAKRNLYRNKSKYEVDSLESNIYEQFLSRSSSTLTLSQLSFFDRMTERKRRKEN